MIQRIIRGSLLLLFVWNGGSVMAQKRPTDVWFFPGLTYDATPATRLSGQPIWFTNAHAGGLWLRAFVQVSKHINLQPGYLFLSRGVTGYQEHTLMNGFTYSAKTFGLVLEDRNLFWDRFRVGARDIHMYRNRLRLIWPFTVDGRSFKVYAYDEVFYHFNAGRWSRNRISVGCSYDIVKVFNLDVSYVHQKDAFSGDVNLFWVIGTVQLRAKKAR